MTAVAFDTLKFARALREKAKLSPEQAEGFAAALVDVLDGNLATKGDIAAVRGDIEALKIQTKADIEALRLSTKADIESVRAEIAASKVETVRWLVGAVGLQTVAILGAVVALTRSLH